MKFKIDKHGQLNIIAPYDLVGKEAPDTLILSQDDTEELTKLLQEKRNGNPR